MKKISTGALLVAAACLSSAFGAGFAMYLRPASASRNSAGSYTPPSPGYPFVGGSVIDQTQVNNLIADLGVTEMSDSLSRSGKGGMLASLRGADGTVGSPAFAWTSEPGSGYYRVGAGDLGLSILGVRVGQVTANGYRTANGAVATPSWSFLNDTGSGLYRAGSNDLRFAVNGADVQKWTASRADITGTLVASTSIGVGGANPGTWTTNGSDVFINSGAAASGIHLRPNGAGSSTGAIDLSAAGAVVNTGLTIGSGGTAISASFRGTTSWTPGSIGSLVCATTTVSLSGAASGADCLATGPTTNDALILRCTITANTCNLGLCNSSAGALTGNSGTYACRAFNP